MGVNPENVERYVGAYTAGSGKAAINLRGDRKRAEQRRLFGCPMIGTFNVALPRGERIRGEPFMSCGPDRYWLVRLRRGDREVYAYAVRWEGSRQRQDRLELMSRHPIPDCFKEGELEVTVYERWSPEEIERWQAGLGNGTKWQGHSFWQPQRSDSALVWSCLEQGQDYEDKTVLDIGCNAGYFSFRAAHRGAVVQGTDKNGGILELARTIQHHIEMTDVTFQRGTSADFLDRHYDYIFYLSVHHQFDPSYKHLGATLKALRPHCDTLFVELINPPLDGGLTKETVAIICGGQELAYYKHRVRCMRSLYVLKS